MASSGFFDAYPRFAETSKTGPSLARLSARHRVLILDREPLFRGARVLDVASHDGRFSFAALRAGAREVVGVEHDPELVDRATANLEAYGEDSDSFRFVCRDLFEGFDDLGRFDVVLCFGILYHVNDHLHLLSSIAAVEPGTVIIDSHVSDREGAVIELRSPLGVSPPEPGSAIEGHPSRAALEAMTSTLGWSGTFVDWNETALPHDDGIDDYLTGRRATYVCVCPPPIDPEVRHLAVNLVFDNQKEPRWQWMAITGIAEHFGINPQALRMWVRKYEREGRGPKTAPTTGDRAEPPGP